MRLLLFFIASAVLGHAMHPADDNADNQISASELAGYIAVEGSTSELAQQAVNIWKHGEAYRTISANGTDYFVPDPATGPDFVALETLNPAPATQVEIFGLPVAPSGYAAYYQIAGVDEVVMSGAVVDSSAGYALVIPAHPITAMQGGQVSFTIYPADAEPTEANSKLTGQVTIQALQSGSFGITQLRSKVSTLAQRMETRNDIDFSEYFTGGPKEFGPFANEAEKAQIAAMRYLLDPNFPGGLVELDTQILTDDDPLLESIRAQVDALIGQSGVEGFIDEYLAEFPADGGAATRSAKMSKAKTPRAYDPSPSNDAELSKLMREQYAAEQVLNSEIFSSETGAKLAVLGLAGAPGKVASAPISVTITGMRVDYESVANTYPAQGSIEATFPIKEYLQDECDKQAQWTAYAIVSSKGWSIDGVATDVVLTAIGAGGAAADGVKAFKSADVVTKTYDTGVRTAMINKSVETYETGRDFARDEIIKNYQNKEASKEIPSETWNIPLAYPYGEMIQGGQAVLTITNNYYQPKDLGTVVVYVRGSASGSTAFPPGRLSPSDPEYITAKPASVDMMGCPPNHYTPGEQYTILATAKDLADLSIVSYQWEATEGTLSNITSIGDGVSSAVWTAPDPAPQGLVTITARARAAICVPVGGADPEGFCITSGSSFDLQVSPEKDCYEVGEQVTLTMVDLNNPATPPDTAFEQVSGESIGSVTKTGTNTATVTATDIGEIGFTATPNGNSANLEFGAFTFGGCDDPIQLLMGPVGGGVWSVGWTSPDGTIAYNMLGYATITGNSLTANFNAAESRQLMIALNDPEDDPPPVGFVGIYSGSGNPVINTALSINLSFSFQEGACAGSPSGSYVTCLEEVDPENTNVTITGLSTPFTLDPFLAGTHTDPFYVINVVPVR